MKQTCKQRQKTKRAVEEAVELPTSRLSDDLLAETDDLLELIGMVLDESC